VSLTDHLSSPSSGSLIPQMGEMVILSLKSLYPKEVNESF